MYLAKSLEIFRRQQGTREIHIHKDMGPILSGKIFASGNFPHHVGSKNALFEKPDNRTKN